MSRAFVKEDDDGGIEPLPDRPVSPHPNMVTADSWELPLMSAALQSISSPVNARPYCQL